MRGGFRGSGYGLPLLTKKEKISYIVFGLFLLLGAITLIYFALD